MQLPTNKLAGWLALVSVWILLPGCGLLPVMGINKDKGSRHRTFFIEPQLPAPQPQTGSCGNLLVGEITGAPGFRSPRMAYTTAPLSIQYYSRSRWSAGFGQLLESQLQQALQNSGQFAHVVSSSSTAETDLRLEFSDLKLLQSFASPEADTSMLFLSVDVRLLQTRPQALLDSHRFEYQSAAAPNAAGGAKIANELAARLLDDISGFTVAVCSRRAGS